MSIKIITGPAVEPVTLAEIKEHLRIYHDEEDNLISSYISAARADAESTQGRAYIEQTILYTLNRWPSRRLILLPRAPLLRVEHIRYIDNEGTEHTLDSTSYTVNSDMEPGAVILNQDEAWPTESLYPYGAIRITFEAGYGDSRDDVPIEIKQALYFLVAHFYENREEVAGRGHIPQVLPNAAKWLLGKNPLFWTEGLNK